MQIWLAPAGRPLRLASLASLEEFLQTAAVLRVEPIGSGIT